MQFSGSPTQSVLHRNRSHDNHPIGGVRATPFSRPCTLKGSCVNVMAMASRIHVVHRCRCTMAAIDGVVITANTALKQQQQKRERLCISY